MVVPEQTGPWRHPTMDTCVPRAYWVRAWGWNSIPVPPQVAQVSGTESRGHLALQDRQETTIPSAVRLPLMSSLSPHDGRTMRRGIGRSPSDVAPKAGYRHQNASCTYSLNVS
jgi:hypothetical protein